MPSVDSYNRDVSEVMEEIMEVGKRPDEVTAEIREFKQAAVGKDKPTAIELVLYGRCLLHKKLQADRERMMEAYHSFLVLPLHQNVNSNGESVLFLHDSCIFFPQEDKNGKLK